MKHVDASQGQLCCQAFENRWLLYVEIHDVGNGEDDVDGADGETSSVIWWC